MGGFALRPENQKSPEKKNYNSGGSKKGKGGTVFFVVPPPPPELVTRGTRRQTPYMLRTGRKKGTHPGKRLTSPKRGKGRGGKYHTTLAP